MTVAPRRNCNEDRPEECHRDIFKVRKSFQVIANFREDAKVT